MPTSQSKGVSQPGSKGWTVLGQMEYWLFALILYILNHQVNNCTGETYLCPYAPDSTNRVMQS